MTRNNLITRPQFWLRIFQGLLLSEFLFYFIFFGSRSEKKHTKHTQTRRLTKIIAQAEQVKAGQHAILKRKSQRMTSKRTNGCFFFFLILGRFSRIKNTKNKILTRHKTQKGRYGQQQNKKGWANSRQEQQTLKTELLTRKLTTQEGYT